MPWSIRRVDVAGVQVRLNTPLKNGSFHGEGNGKQEVVENSEEVEYLAGKADLNKRSR